MAEHPSDKARRIGGDSAREERDMGGSGRFDESNDPVFTELKPERVVLRIELPGRAPYEHAYDVPLEWRGEAVLDYASVTLERES